MEPSRLRVFVLGLIALGALFVAYFGVRTLSAYREFRRHPPPRAEGAAPYESDVELIREWMTIPFIARMYHVPPDLLFDALGIKPGGNREKSLRQLNEEYFPGRKGFVLTAVQDALRTTQERRELDRSAPSTGIPATPVP